MLDGLRVVELGGTVATSAAGAMYRRLGADVARVPSGRPAPRAGTQKARLLEILDRGKRTLAGGPFDEDAIARAAQADVVVADLTETDHGSQPGLLEAYAELVRRHNASSWVTLTPFGLRGPLSRRRGSELIAVASGGMANYMRSSAGRPMKPAGFTASITAGHYAALAGMHGLLLRRDGAGPVHLDLSAQDTVVVTGVFLECAHRLFECSGEGGSSRYAAPRGLVACGTGLIWIVVLEDHQWRACLKAMGDPGWAAGIVTGDDRQRHHDVIQERLAEWAAGMTARECAERLQATGVPATAVNSCADLQAGVGLDVRQDFFVDGERPDERLPDVPFQLVPRSGDAGAAATPNGHRRHRVLDLTQVLVAPLATSWLGAMGLDVLKVEDPDRIDVYRRRGPFLEERPGLERGAYFSFANYSKRSHAVPLGTPAGRRRLDELIASADVVVQNLVGRALAIGVTPAHVGDDLGSSLVSCAGFGRTTAYSAFRAYGMNIQAAGGVVSLSRDRFGRPTNLGTSWADPLTSVWLCMATIGQLLRPRSERSSVDVSMVEVVAHEFMDYYSALTADRVELIADESRLDHAAPHGIYRCQGEDRWLALAVETDAEWQRFLDALGRPEPLARARYDTLEGRLAAQDELDEALDRALSGCERGELFDRLQAAGVICSPVWNATDLTSLDHLRARGLLRPVRHPVWDGRQLIGLPWRVDDAAVPITATPLLGEHTTDDPARWWVAEQGVS